MGDSDDWWRSVRASASNFAQSRQGRSLPTHSARAFSGFYRISLDSS